MTANSQLLTATLKTKTKKQTKQTTRTGTESQKWRSRGGLSVGRRWGRIRGKGTGNKKHSKEAQDKQREVKNSMGNGEAKELICITHGHELRGGGMQVEGGVQCGGE